MDAIAASVAYLHCNDLSLMIVTAAVDRIDILHTFARVSNVRVRGAVTYVGRSSMEVTVSVETADEAGWELAALAKFIMVARSPDGTRAIPINTLLLETDQEREQWRRGEERQRWRKRRDANRLFRLPPTEEESRLIHSLFFPTTASAAGVEVSLESRALEAPSSRPFSKLSSLRICHPQERNLHNRIFGGYLVREAFELAYACACLYSQHPVKPVSLDEMAFVHPVEIGSLISIEACCVFTNDRLVHVEVQADVVEMNTGARFTTNTFHFTFEASQPVIPVRPQTYPEAMKWLEGRRRLEIH